MWPEERFLWPKSQKFSTSFFTFFIDISYHKLSKHFLNKIACSLQRHPSLILLMLSALKNFSRKDDLPKSQNIFNSSCNCSYTFSCVFIPSKSFCFILSNSSCAKKQCLMRRQPLILIFFQSIWQSLAAAPFELNLILCLRTTSSLKAFDVLSSTSDKLAIISSPLLVSFGLGIAAHVKTYKDTDNFLVTV
jgi:hypothetical protein